MEKQSMQIVIDDLYKANAEGMQVPLIPYEFRHTSFWNALAVGPDEA